MPFSARLLTVCTALLLAACTSTGGQRSTSQPLLAGGHGVDHVTILTEDLSAAAAQFAEGLGFRVGAPNAYGFGFTGANIHFADQTYIELYDIHDPAKVAAVGEGFAIDAPPGVRWVTLHSGSTQQTAELLQARGIPAWAYTLPEDAGPDAWLYKLAGPEQPVLPGGRMYFVEYNEPRRASTPRTASERRARETHANGAVGLESVWIAVQDLAAAARRYEAARLMAGPEILLPALQAPAREIHTPGGTVLLVQQTGTEDAFYGISIRTTDLEAVRAMVQKTHALELVPYAGLYGRSVLVPPRIASGTAIEFFE